MLAIYLRAILRRVTHFFLFTCQISAKLRFLNFSKITRLPSDMATFAELQFNLSEIKFVTSSSLDFLCSVPLTVH